jgi:hypothetical protein
MTTVASAAAQSTLADPTMSTFRVFLKSGKALPSYGESTVVGDRIVFSLLVGAPDAAPRMQFVDLPVSAVDLDRTARYARAVRTAYLEATTGEAEYQAVTSDVASLLDAIPAIPDPTLRLELAQDGRQRLKSFAATHYDFRAAQVADFIAEFDGVIGQMTGNTGNARVTMDLVAGRGAGAIEHVLPPPSLRESIEAALFASRAADDIATREAVLRAVVDLLGAAGPTTPADPNADLADDARHRLDLELDADRAYAALGADLTSRAEAARRRGDVAAIESLMRDLSTDDASLGAALGSARPAAVQAIADGLAARLAVARVYRAALDHYAIEKAKLLAYEHHVRSAFGALDDIAPVLAAIQSGRRASFDTTTRAAARLAAVTASLATITPPADLASVHSALTSAVQLARAACETHRRGLVAPNALGAAGASAAAAGARLLVDQARQDLVTRLFPPKAS